MCRNMASRQVFNKYVNRLIEVFEVIIVVALLVLAIYTIVFLVRDISSIKPSSPIEELRVVFSSVLAVIVIVELVRTFTVSRIGEEYFEGFIEVGIIILLREIAVSTISGDILYALMASGGVLLLALALFVIKRSRAIGK